MKGATLRVKFSAAVVAIIVASMGLLGGLLVPSMRRPIEDANRRKAEALVRNVAANGRESLLTNDEQLLGQFLDQLRKEEPSLLEAMILDAKGAVVVHSDVRVRPGTLLPVPPGSLTVPIEVNGKTVGHVAARFSQQEGERAVARATRLIVGLTGFLLVLGIAASVALVRYFTRPLKTLAAGAAVVGQGDLDHRIEVTSRDELGELAHAFNEMTARLKKAQEDRLEQERMKQELRIAKEIQASLLPRECPTIPGFDLGTLYRSAKEIGGDYYDFFWVDAHRLGIVIADVAGKGVPGALGMTVARNTFRAQAQGQAWPSHALAKTHMALRHHLRPGLFVTMFYAILDIRDRALTCSNAGHQPLLVFRAAGGYEVIDPPGMALGFGGVELFEKTLTDVTVQLHAGDLAVMYSDGVSEAMNDAGEEFGDRRVIQAFETLRGRPMADTVKEVERGILGFTNHQAQRDDMTVVALKVV